MFQPVFELPLVAEPVSEAAAPPVAVPFSAAAVVDAVASLVFVAAASVLALFPSAC